MNGTLSKVCVPALCHVLCRVSSVIRICNLVLAHWHAFYRVSSTYIANNWT